MLSRGRPFARLIVLAAVLFSVAPASPRIATSALPMPAGVGIDPQASFRPEVRLRKLHLVRPDLIPYPIAYEVYC